MFGSKDTDRIVAALEVVSKKLDALASPAPADADCPLYREPCRQEKCRWFKRIIGENPNTGETINEGNCAIAFLPFLQIENTQQMRQAGAAMETLRNAFVEAERMHVRMIGVASGMNGTALIEGKVEGNGGNKP